MKDKKISIMFYSESFIFGGAEKYLNTLIKNLDFKKYSIKYASPEGNSLRTYKGGLKKFGVEMLTIEPVKNKFDLINFFSQYRLFKEHAVDILHVNLPNPYHSQFTIIAGRMSRTPNIVVTHHLPDRIVKVTWRGRILESLLTRCIDKVITVSEFGKKIIMERLSFPEEKVTTILNGIDQEDIKHPGRDNLVRERLGIKSLEKVVGIVGRFTEQKGYRYFAEAASIVKKEIKNIKFLLVGDGPLRKEIERLINLLNLVDNIIFTGYREDVYPLLEIVDIFVMPSIYEGGLPLAIQEAMLMKKPVIATNIGGNNEIVLDGETGILVPSSDSVSLAKAIILLLKDKKRAEKLGEKGARRIKEYFSSALMVKKTEKLYEDLLVKIDA